MSALFSKLATFLAVAALGGLTGAALAGGSQSPPAPVTQTAPAPPAEVRTKVIHRTIRIVKHVKAPAVATPPPTPAVRTPVVRAPAPAPVVPVRRTVAAQPRLTTHTSGSSGHGESEDDGGEGGDD